MKVFFDMVGCRLNQAEIDALALDFAWRQAEIVTKPEQADMIIINTCCVTAKASADSRKMIRHYQEKYPAKVVSTGCWVSVEGDQAEMISDEVFSNYEKENIPLFYLGYSDAKPQDISTKPKLGRRNRTRGFVKIQDGCNNACSYCLTRIARGASVSIKQEAVIKHINTLTSMGVQEVVLTGVQLGSWGKDFLPRNTIAELLSSIINNTEVPRIRLSSIEPWDINDSLLQLLKHPRVCPHLHIPIQSGSDSILRRMKRPSTTKSIRDLLERVRSIAPNAAVTTDVIVGFPGETDQLFDKSFEFIKACDFSGGHVFSFSPMPGTEALEMDGKVQESVVKERTRKLLDYFSEQNLHFKQQKIGQQAEVLFESADRNALKKSYIGFTEDYLKVSCASESSLINQVNPVLLMGINSRGVLEGTLIED